MAEILPPSENGVPLVPDNGKKGPGQPSKVDAIDPQVAIDCIYKHHGIMFRVLDELKISYPTFLKLRRKHKRVERAFWFAHRRLRPDYARHLVYKWAERDAKVAWQLGARVCEELKPPARVVNVGVGQNPNAQPIQMEHKAVLVNVTDPVGLLEKMKPEDRAVALEGVQFDIATVQDRLSVDAKRLLIEHIEKKEGEA